MWLSPEMGSQAPHDKNSPGASASDSSSDLEKIGMTGAASFLGGQVLRRLSELPTVREIHIFDVRPPEVPCSKYIFHRVDLARDTADSEMADTLLRAGVKTFIHGALFSGPGRSAHAREVESIGTFHVLNAVAEAGVRKLLVNSATFVYGANSKNPNFLLETFPLRDSGPRFVRMRVDVEKQVQEFARDYPGTAVTVLRFAPILGPNSSNVRARYFMSGVVPKLMGYDPLLQFIHEDDAVRAEMLALTSSVTGVFNIVGRGVVPLSTGIHISGRLPIPIATPACRTVFSIGHLLRVWDLSPELIPFFQYLCVADGRKAESVLGFKARFSCRQALKSMMEAHRLRSVGFSVPSAAFGEDEAAIDERGFERVY